jgi:hypothetical protein
MELKKIGLFLFFIIAMGLMVGACTEKSFSGSSDSVFQQCVDVRPEVKCRITCDTSGGCVENYDYTITTDQQVKDILFVVDVSGSMSEEQARMGSMFPNFVNSLADVDYRIAITTTDVRDRFDVENGSNPPDAVNGFGAFQDGNLIPFNDGSPFLDGTLTLLTEQSFFEDTITWEQTLICERKNFVEQHCPTGDERGILAAAMTFEKNPANFIRPVGHMAVIVLSDEDEGSVGDAANSIAEPLREEPQAFINYFRNLYPNKSLTFHSIIVEPRDLVPRWEIQGNGQTRCFNQQDHPNSGPHKAPDGKYGTVYASLSRLTEGAVIGDICANDSNYSEQLEEIGRSVSEVREVLPCSPIDGEVQVDLIPDPGYSVDVIKNLSQNEILFSEPIPQGTEVRFRFRCLE